MDAIRAIGVFSAFLLSTQILAVQPDQKTLPIGFAPHELGRPDSTPAPLTAAPIAPIHSLGEWEQSDSVMTLWSNASWINALAQRGPVTLLADTDSDRTWWQGFLRDNKIPQDRVSYFVVPTDSMWVRDYGPWFIVDGNGGFGLVDTKYNRPRPQDDVFPGFVSRTLGIPMYQPGLTHTGGNYYNDGVGNAFSSTLPYTENSSLTAEQVRSRMHDYLGIDSYITSRLNPKISIEHLDTYGKLVAPDTWVFSEFPQGSRFRADSEAYLAMLKTLKSPYGTPYRIFRMKMVSGSSGGEVYHAYLNSFISNGALYFPTYGDSFDADARKVYQAALPAYEIVGVDAGGTEWGDSVHCRSRNLLRRNTVFIFPQVPALPALASQDVEVLADVIPSPGAQIDTPPLVQWTVDGAAVSALEMEHVAGFRYRALIPGQPSGAKVSLFVEAKDSAGVKKTAPQKAPAMQIEFSVP